MTQHVYSWVWYKEIENVCPHEHFCMDAHGSVFRESQQVEIPPHLYNRRENTRVISVQRTSWKGQEDCHVPPHEQTLRKWHQGKEARHTRSRRLRFHGIGSRTVRPVERESGCMFAWSWLLTECGVSFWDDEGVLKWVEARAVQLGHWTKSAYV